MYGETWGDGPPSVLVLHGWRRTHADFAGSVGPAWPEGPLPTLAPDLPGFGATPAPAVAWGSVDYAAAVARLFDAPPQRGGEGGAREERGGEGGAREERGGEGGGGEGGARRVVVVGHSLGGRIAVRLAAARPELVGALVLSGAPLVARGGRRRPPVVFRVARAMHRAHLVGDARMERARRRHGSADYRAAEGVIRDILVRLVNERYDDALAAVRCPVELVWGDDDAEAPLSVASAIVDALPDARLTVCPGAGHLTPLTAPGELRAAVERALARRT